MKKVKYVLLALAVMLVLIGAAYAAWSETLTITGTAAAGDIDVQFTNDDGGTLPGTDVVIAGDGKTMTVTLTDVYPGFNETITYDVTNGGSLAVELDAIDPTIDPGLIVVNSLAVGNSIAAGGTLSGQTLVVTVDDNADYQATFSFTIELSWVVDTP